MKKPRISSMWDIEVRINLLRLKLSELYAKQGNTTEVVKISQELDEYIYLAQQLSRNNIKDRGNKTG